jgi:hypothetical protein
LRLIRRVALSPGSNDADAPSEADLQAEPAAEPQATPKGLRKKLSLLAADARNNAAQRASAFHGPGLQHAAPPGVNHFMS